MIRRIIYFLAFCLASLTAAAENGHDASIGNIAALRADMNMEQIIGMGAATIAPAPGEEATQASPEEMKRYLRRQRTWLTTGYLTATAGSAYLFYFAVIKTLSDYYSGGDVTFAWAIPGGTLLGLSAVSFVMAHQNSLKAKKLAPDLTTYQIERLKSIGKATAIAGATNLVVVVILDRALSSGDLMGLATPALGFGIASAVCFIKANEKKKKASLSLGATAVREPVSMGKSVARPALSLCLNF